MTRKDFNVDSYRFSHGHDPRGRGNWWMRFKISDGAAYDRNFAGVTFSEARKAALKAASAKCWQIEVLP